MSDVEDVPLDAEGQPSLDESLESVTKELAAVTRQIRQLEAKKRALERRQAALEERRQARAAEELKSQNWGRKEFPWSEKLDTALKDVFKLKSYRTDQLAVINASLSGHDLLLIMPTGGGKSLTYQLPAVVSKGITLVISPLLSLMEDQIMALKRLGVSAEMLSSSNGREESSRIMREMMDSKSSLKLLYVTPEKCAKSKQFMTKLQKLFQMGRLERIAIDEVHCCSQWGHDFRPDYKFLGAMKGMFPEVPIIGLTATSTSHVTNDVKEILRIPHAMVFLSGFNRPNLHYSVRLKPDVAEENYELLTNLLKTEFRGQSGIIYTTTIKEVETLTKELTSRGLKVGPYHAQMEPVSKRSLVHKAWVHGQIQAVVATVAFGMGIDKPDVRFVIHNTISKSMENFYQESGRAGRDDKPAKCILFFRLADVFKQSTMVFTEQTGLQKLYSMVGYCLSSDICRRNIIAEHFLDTWEPIPCNKMCDNCERTEDNAPRFVDVTDYGEAAVKILKQARTKEIRVTGLKLVEALQGRGAGNIKIQGWKGDGKSKEAVEHILGHLIVEGYLKEDFHFTPYSTISYILPGHREVRSIKLTLPANNTNVNKGSVSSSKSKPDSTKRKNRISSDDEWCDEKPAVTKKSKSEMVIISDSDSD